MTTLFPGVGQVHPSIRLEMRRTIQNLGFADMNEWDAFWADWNRKHRTENLESPIDPPGRYQLILKALEGEKINLKAIYDNTDSDPQAADFFIRDLEYSRARRR
jgi:hypothetical protein